MKNLILFLLKQYLYFQLFSNPQSTSCAIINSTCNWAPNIFLNFKFSDVTKFCYRVKSEQVFNMVIMLLYTFLSNKSVVFNLASLHIEMDYKTSKYKTLTGSFLGGMLDFLEKQHFQLHCRLVNSSFSIKIGIVIEDTC